MEKENVLEIEFKQVWGDEPKWAWRITKNNVKNNTDGIIYQNVKLSGNNLFLFDYVADNRELISPYILLDTNEKEDVEEFIEYINEKYGIPKRWRAEKGEKYYFVSSKGVIDIDSDDYCKVDTYRYNLGNYFKTEEETQAIRNSQEWQDFWEKVRAGEIGGEE